MMTATPNSVTEFTRIEKLKQLECATDVVLTVGASHLIGSADLLAGSALIRYIPSHLNQVSHTRAFRSGSTSKKKIRQD